MFKEQNLLNHRNSLFQLLKDECYHICESKSSNGRQCFKKVFEKSKVAQLGLTQTLRYNQKIIKMIPSFVFKEVFLSQQFVQTEQTYEITCESYDIRMDQELIKTKTEVEARQIFMSILKAVYSIFIVGLQLINLRADHFVGIKKNNKYLWKIATFIGLGYEIRPEKQRNSEYLYLPEYSPPESYTKNINSTIDEKIVWDMGCILIHILTGSHKLKAQDTLKKFKNYPFNFSVIGTKTEQHISSDFEKMIGKMCHYNHSSRVRLGYIFQSGFFSLQVRDRYVNQKQGKLYIQQDLCQKRQTKQTIDFEKEQIYKNLSIQNKNNHLNLDIELYQIMVQGCDQYENTIRQCFPIEDDEFCSDLIKLLRFCVSFFCLQYHHILLQSAKTKIQTKIFVQSKQRLARWKDEADKNFHSIQITETIENKKWRSFFKKDPLNSNFNDIKQAYRQIIGSLENIVSSTYNLRKQKFLIELQFYLIFCLAIDKICNDKGFTQQLFGLDRQNHLSKHYFTCFIKETSQIELIQKSNLICKHFFERKV